MRYFIYAIIFMSTFYFVGCQPSGENVKAQEEKPLAIDYKKVTLDNGLDVIMHQDKSDPIVAVAILIHAGSNREKPGRTGFAHFFEHMLFQKSENVGSGEFFKNINEWGGTMNGGTWTDGTIYFEVVPKDALEKVLWMESDRMGYFINSVDKASLEGEKPVVKNEKRQRVDNVPFGHTNYVIGKALYPEGHPYNWQVIGELEDLNQATLDDVKEFYELYYGPNNATLVVTGDFEQEATLNMVKKYFGEIPKRGIDQPIGPKPVTLSETIKLYHEDDYASLPELRMTWPTVENYHPDSWALNALGEILSTGKRAPLYKAVVEKHSYAPNASAYHSALELAGTFTVRVRGNRGVDLDSVQAAVLEGMAQFEKDGVNPKDLDRIKAKLETDFYGSISSVLNKAFQLASYNEFTGSPDFIKKDIENIKQVSAEDIMRVYKQYIKGKAHIMTSFVPKGQGELIVSESEKATVKEEPITPNTETALAETEPTPAVVKTASSFDRSIAPPFGAAPMLSVPEIWTGALANGMKAYGIVANEVPLVNFSIRLEGGHLFDTPEKNGVANLVTDLMMEGTQQKTPEELEDAIGQLGARINITVSPTYITLSANCLARNYAATVALVEEILTQPRWDTKEFERIKKAAITLTRQRDTNPNSIARMVMAKKLYGENSILGLPVSGTIESIEGITLDDLKGYYQAYFSPSVAKFHVAGDVSQQEALAQLESLAKNWKAKEVTVPKPTHLPVPEKPQVFFVDVPNAKQSVIGITRFTMPRNDADYFPLTVANYMLGGSTSGLFFQILREEKGYTYGARSSSVAGKDISRWQAASSVRSNVTKESMDTFKEIITGYRSDYSEEYLRKTKSALIKSNTRNYETLSQLIGILHNISTYELPMDYLNQQQQTLQAITLSDVQGLINEYIDLSKMVYVVVGDKATQFDRLSVEGEGNPILVDKYGEVVTGG